jgi:integrase
MKLEPFNSKSGYRVWLSNQEQNTLIDYYEEDPEKQLAIILMLHGLRSDEVNDVCIKDIRDMDVEDEAYMLVIRDGKTGYRECPISTSAVSLAKMLKNVKGVRKSEALVDVSKRTIQRYVSRACEDIADRPNEPDSWEHVSAHDLRRSWATQTYWSLSGSRAREVVMEFGGWVDTQTFTQNYLGAIPDETAIEVMKEANLD